MPDPGFTISLSTNVFAVATTTTSGTASPAPDLSSTESWMIPRPSPSSISSPNLSLGPSLSSSSSSSFLSVASIAGLAIGSIAGLAIDIASIFVILRARRKPLSGDNTGELIGRHLASGPETVVYTTARYEATPQSPLFPRELPGNNSPTELASTQGKWMLAS
ncbi:hypothetical protein BS50DRAFT_87222 [Corynespora cassiicola Philippines]|uniref:Uncharacterized protein n=1 Tax=Corynespora cassiicola Philippines TaxID=1448308 RepID=A0A2T2NE45_CORCC|nr:hypothetical protein BS50DRAFT_87222 [Corynespora cassiicola Philippines]